MKIKDYFLTQEDFELTPSTQYKGVLQLKEVPSDLGKYYESENYISHTKDHSLKSKLYTFIQNLNNKYKLNLIQKYCDQGTLLDYGCGDGSFLGFIKENNFSVLGYEPNTKASAIAKDKVGAQSIVNNLEEIENNSLDVITLWHVLEHIPNPEEVLQKLSSKLNKEGIIIIALPNHDSYDAKFYKKEWAAWDVPRHIFHYSRKGALQFFQENNFKILKTYPLLFDSYYISLISENYKKSWIKLLRFPIIGSISNFKGVFSKDYSSVVYIIRK